MEAGSVFFLCFNRRKTSISRASSALCSPTTRLTTHHSPAAPVDATALSLPPACIVFILEDCNSHSALSTALNATVWTRTHSDSFTEQLAPVKTIITLQFYAASHVEVHGIVLTGTDSKLGPIIMTECARGRLWSQSGQLLSRALRPPPAPRPPNFAAECHVGCDERWSDQCTSISVEVSDM